MDESRRDMCIVAVGNTRLARCMSQATCFVLLKHLMENGLDITEYSY